VILDCWSFEVLTYVGSANAGGMELMLNFQQLTVNRRGP